MSLLHLFQKIINVRPINYFLITKPCIFFVNSQISNDCHDMAMNIRIIFMRIFIQINSIQSIVYILTKLSNLLIIHFIVLAACVLEYTLNWIYEGLVWVLRNFWWVWAEPLNGYYPFDVFVYCFAWAKMILKIKAILMSNNRIKFAKHNFWAFVFIVVSICIIGLRRRLVLIWACDINNLIKRLIIELSCVAFLVKCEVVLVYRPVRSFLIFVLYGAVYWFETTCSHIYYFCKVVIIFLSVRTKYI